MMDFLDAVSRGMDKLASKLDAYAAEHRTETPETGFSIMDKDYCWEDLDFAGDQTLQRHVVTGDCRIVDKYGLVRYRGTQAQLEQIMMQQHDQYAAARHSGAYSDPAVRVSAVQPPVPVQPVAPVQPAAPAVHPAFTAPQPVQAKYGDIIGVVRRNGAYEHYGIYVSDTCVIHYAIPASMTIGHATVHATNLRNFLRDDSEYFVLDFPRPYVPPVRIGDNSPQNNSISSELARHLQQRYGYHLYTPEETVQRAKTRLGETSYNLFTNNCEHFVIWCKTGVSESLQVTGMLQSLLSSQNWTFRRPAHW